MAKVLKRVFVLFPDNIEISFPVGTLAGSEYFSVMGFDYSDEILALMQPWAVPDSMRG